MAVDQTKQMAWCFVLTFHLCVFNTLLYMIWTTTAQTGTGFKLCNRLQAKLKPYSITRVTVHCKCTNIMMYYVNVLYLP